MLFISGLSLAAEPPKVTTGIQVFRDGDRVYAQVEIANDGDPLEVHKSPGSIDFIEASKGEFDPAAREGRGTIKSHSFLTGRNDREKVVLRAGEKFTKKIDLTDWIKDLKPGRYSVRATWFLDKNIPHAKQDVFEVR